ncbi:hypothetical protein [Pararhizobium gei]|uniref:hypothetical protein n=1 Tax=Pararhizobium gei TaxID=1395951 RepID=UPI0023DAA379|nr:hypothetical protein [Rhizobium gei]
MNVTERDIAIFRAAFYNNTGDETDDPIEIGLRAVFAARPSCFVRIDAERQINPADVSAMVWDRRFYMNGSATTLVITMRDGSVHRLENDAWTDAFAIEQKIQAAVGGVL